jgi:hypothetical protein
MFKKRKAQGLSITTIIVAVIGIIILVVLIAIFTGRLGDFSAGVEKASSCETMCQALDRQPGTAPDAGGKCKTDEKAVKVSDKCCCKPK